MRPRQNRREFMGLTVAGVAGLLTRPLHWLTPIDPHLVGYNAKGYTINSAMPRAEAFAVSGTRFSALGSSADMRALIGKKTQVIDAKGMTIVPGFTDTHNHAGGTTLLYEVLVGNPFEVEFVTIESIIDKLKA